MPGPTWCRDADCRLLLGTEANITRAIAEVVLSSKLAKGNHKQLAFRLGLLRPRETPYTTFFTLKLTATEQSTDPRTHFAYTSHGRHVVVCQNLLA